MTTLGMTQTSSNPFWPVSSSWIKDKFSPNWPSRLLFILTGLLRRSNFLAIRLGQTNVIIVQFHASHVGPNVIKDISQ